MKILIKSNKDANSTTKTKVVKILVALEKYLVLVNIRIKRAISIKIDQYTKIFKFLNEIEFDLKCKNNIDKECYLLSALLNLQEILSQNSKF